MLKCVTLYFCINFKIKSKTSNLRQRNEKKVSIAKQEACNHVFPEVAAAEKAALSWEGFSFKDVKTIQTLL